MLGGIQQNVTIAGRDKMALTLEFKDLLVTGQNTLGPLVTGQNSIPWDCQLMVEGTIQLLLYGCQLMLERTQHSK